MPNLEINKLVVPMWLIAASIITFLVLLSTTYFTEKRITWSPFGFESVSVVDTVDPESMKPYIDQQVDNRMGAQMKGAYPVPTGAIILVSNKIKCPPESIELAGVNLQVNKENSKLLGRAQSVTTNSTWNQSAAYDGMVFQACMYN